MAGDMEHIQFYAADVHKIKFNTVRMVWEGKYMTFDTVDVRVFELNTPTMAWET